MKLSTIVINGVPFTYTDEMEDITYETNSPITESDAVELLDKTQELFNQIGLKYWLAFGTLLGAVRDGTIIPGDDDVDIIISDEQKLFQNIPFLNQNGYKLVRFLKGDIYTFRINQKGYIDVYIKRELFFSPWSIYCVSVDNYVLPRKLFQGSSFVLFAGKKYPCQNNPEKFLEFQYGKNWRIPQKSKGRTDVYSYLIWRKIKFCIVKIIGFCIGYKYWKGNFTSR